MTVWLNSVEADFLKNQKLHFVTDVKNVSAFERVSSGSACVLLVCFSCFCF